MVFSKIGGYVPLPYVSAPHAFSQTEKSRPTKDTTSPRDEASESKKDQCHVVKKTVTGSITNTNAEDTEDLIIATGYGIKCRASAFPSALCDVIDLRTR